ncbi:MAG: hypothetical protein DI585_00835 [Pseudomonas fluorescens]|nr:MAG: hypothetical protein DI585_00835 [Pseudomonas fluorescens]
MGTKFYRIVGIGLGLLLTILLALALTQVFGNFFIALGVICSTCTVVLLAWTLPELKRVLGMN